MNRGVQWAIVALLALQVCLTVWVGMSVRELRQRDERRDYVNGLGNVPLKP